jgi:hypothetical protein
MDRCDAYELGCHGTALVTKWRIILYDALLDKMVQREQVLTFPNAVKVSAAER